MLAMDIFHVWTYLLPNKVWTVQEQRAIFSLKTRMNTLKNNYQRNSELKNCQCEFEKTNNPLYECKVLNSSEKEVPYKNIFEGRLCVTE